ncbi:MAG: hypothetical protein VB084_05905 [Syntrophomonadaceae bacterium]|nr:hypothetical protein [Syntrophomonadaceae bacterium]
MLDLDFAFFNMREDNRKGLANRKSFLDKLAPFLFPPRVERLINFGRMGLQGCNVMLPLGEGNWSILNSDNRDRMLEKTGEILNEYDVPRMGVDRRLMEIFAAREHSLPVVFGDWFISILSAVLVEAMISRHDIQKLILVGAIPQLEPFINNIVRYNIPISMQNYYPGRYEILKYRLLYEEGLAVSNSYLNPQNWNKGDLIISVDLNCRSLALASPQAFYIRLDNERSGMAPEWEEILRGAGLSPQLHTLAPILETCLLAQAGKIDHDGEERCFNQADKGKEFYQAMIEVGHVLGLWEPFLDKGL